MTVEEASAKAQRIDGLVYVLNHVDMFHKSGEPVYAKIDSNFVPEIVDALDDYHDLLLKMEVVEKI